MSRLRPGDVFAGYTIERELGAGGMGEVYLARHPRLPRHDALKVLAAGLGDDPHYRARFEREADVVAALRHPSIVGVHDRGEFDGRLWIALDYVDGHDLTRHVSADRLPPREVARIIAQIADALDAAARHGLTHRDVKPANILLEDSGRAQLTDFGIAHPGQESTRLTGTGVALGTVAFAAPEQLQGHGVDSRADQYSLACTAFALLTGTNVYSGGSVAAIALAHVRDPIPAASARAPGWVPPAVDGVLARGLAKDRDHRYRDNRTFAAALTEAVTAPPRTYPAATTFPPPPAAPHPTASPLTVSAPTTPPPTRPVPHTAAPIAAQYPPDPTGMPWQVSGPGPAHPGSHGTRPPGTGRHRWLLIGALVVVVVLVAGAVTTWLFTSDDSDDDTPGRGTTLSALASPRTEPLWTWAPTVVSDQYQEDLGIVGGTSRYAVAVSKSSSGATILGVLDAAGGKTVRTITLSDRPVAVKRCQQLGDPGSSTLVCWGADVESVGDPQPYVIDVAAGTADKTDAEGDYFAVTGDNYVLVADDGVYGGSAGRKNFAVTGVTVPSSYPVVNGSPVIDLKPSTGSGKESLHRVTDGKAVHTLDDDRGESWQPFANGFVVRTESSDSDRPPTFTFYDAEGTVTAEMSGEWTLPLPPTDSPIPPSVAPVPVLLNTSQTAIAAFDPVTGKQLWQKSYQIDSPNSAEGFGSKIVLTASGNEFEWFDARDGSGGSMYVPPKGTQAGSPLGSDGVRFAMLSRPAYGGTGPQELLVFEQNNANPIWQMRVPTSGQYPGAPVIAGGKVYAGGGLEFGDRRIL